MQYNRLDGKPVLRTDQYSEINPYSGIQLSYSPPLPSLPSPPQVRKHYGQRHYIGEDKYLPSAGFERRKSQLLNILCAPSSK